MLRKLAIPGVLALLMVMILACGGAAEPTEPGRNGGTHGHNRTGGYRIAHRGRNGRANRSAQGDGRRR